jgi:hypothetical protein
VTHPLAYARAGRFWRTLVRDEHVNVGRAGPRPLRPGLSPVLVLGLPGDRGSRDEASGPADAKMAFSKDPEYE